MFCENCGSKLPDDAKFCNICGAAVQQDQDSQQSQVQTPVLAKEPVIQAAPEINIPVPAKKKKWPIILAIVLAAVLVIGAAGALAYKFVIAPAMEKNDKKTEQTGKPDADEPAIIGLMEMSKGSLVEFSGANLKLEMKASGMSIKGNGFFDLGRDLEDSVAYFGLSALGQKVELAFTDGLFIYNDGSSVNSVSLSDISSMIGIDLNDLIKDGSINTEAILTMAEDLYAQAGISLEDIPINDITSMGESWVEYMRDNTDAVNEAFTVKSQTNDKIEYQIHIEEFYDMFFDYLEDLADNGSAGERDMAESLLDALDTEEFEDVLDELQDINITMQMDGKQLKSVEARMEIEDSMIVSTVKLDGDYLGEISVSVSGEVDVEFSLTLSNHNKPDIDEALLSSLEDRATMAEWDDYDDYEYDDYDYYDDDYLFPSDTQYITESYLRTLSRDDVALLRNEIYARHGYVFKTQKYKDYFGSKSWYSPNPGYDGVSLSAIEAANRDTIVAYEASKGWN